MSSFLTRSSINVNPSNSQEGLTGGTTDWLWAVFAIMLVSDLVFIFWSWRRPIGSRVFHQLPILILTTATIAYFAMASNLGGTPVMTEFGYRTTRAIWYARYIDWTITTPLLLLELLLGTGLPLSDIVTVIFMDIAMIVTGLIGALVATRYKWGFFTFGCAALIYIWGVLLGPARVSAGNISLEARKAYVGSAAFLSFLWMLYPICWGLADGGNILRPSGEMIFYGVLDILAKPVFCFWHAFALRRVAYAGYGLSSGKASVGAGNLVGNAAAPGRTSDAGYTNGAGTTAGAGYTNGAGATNGATNAGGVNPTMGQRV